MNKQLMLLDGMAAKYGLQTSEFSATVRAACGMPNATPEEFAAFISVCREYGLNPITREIYAMPRKGGGLIPVVGIDGWIHLINDHPAADGFEFESHESNGELVAITCRMYRKDRSHPVVVTEYLAECMRVSEPWKMKHRMLRHKALIQAARYAFGFSGIYEEDEAARYAGSDMRDITPSAPPKPPVKSLSQPIEPSLAQRPMSSVQRVATPPKPPVKAPKLEPKPEPAHDPETGEVIETPDDILKSLDEMMASAGTEDEVEEVWDHHDIEARFETAEGGDRIMGLAMAIKRKHAKRLAND